MKNYKIKFIEAGVCNYPEQDLIIYISLDTLRKIAPSFNGKPVTIDHIMNDNQAMNESVGIIKDVFYDEQDGWFYANAEITDDRAIKYIDEQGWYPSCAYEITKKGESGRWHKIDYDFEVLNAEYKHLAIVEKPRYEQSDIIANKDEVTKKMFKLFQKKKVEVLANSEDVKLEDIFVETEDGEVNLSEAINALIESEKQKDPEKPLANMDDEYEVGDKKMKVSEIINAYKALNACKENADEEEEKEEKKEKLANSDDFQKIKEAANKQKKEIVIQSYKDGFKHGRYGQKI